MAQAEGKHNRELMVGASQTADKERDSGEFLWTEIDRSKNRSLDSNSDDAMWKLQIDGIGSSLSDDKCR
uniref:Uncharacterized protein n=1 Tax=Cucumis melo TaxID=3656 RepID=A0A9I9D4P2_CUCME